MPLNPATDWTKFTLLPYESASITSIRPSNLPNVTVTVANTTWGKVNNRQMQQTNGAYVRPSSSVLIPISGNTNAAGPWKPGDTITRTQLNPVDGSSTVTYTIQTVDYDGYYWFLGVFNPAIAFDLRDLTDIILRTITISDILTPLSTPSTVVSNAICRRQPTDARMDTLIGRQDGEKYFDVFFATNQDINPALHSLSWTENAVTYIADIDSVVNSARIDELQLVRARVK